MEELSYLLISILIIFYMIFSTLLKKKFHKYTNEGTIATVFGIMIGLTQRFLSTNTF